MGIVRREVRVPAQHCQLANHIIQPLSMMNRTSTSPHFIRNITAFNSGYPYLIHNAVIRNKSDNYRLDNLPIPPPHHSSSYSYILQHKPN